MGYLAVKVVKKEDTLSLHLLLIEVCTFSGGETEEEERHHQTITEALGPAYLYSIAKVS